MSIAGVASTALYSVLNGIESRHNNQNNFQQFQSEFQQLGQDLQSGNLTQAQQDYATLSQNLPNAAQANTGTTGNPIAQAFSALTQDLQSGNLSAAQQQDLQQIGGLGPSSSTGGLSSGTALGPAAAARVYFFAVSS